MAQAPHRLGFEAVFSSQKLQKRNMAKYGALPPADLNRIILYHFNRFVSHASHGLTKFHVCHTSQAQLTKISVFFFFG